MQSPRAQELRGSAMNALKSSLSAFIKPVAHFKSSIKPAISQLFQSQNTMEFCKFVRELNTPQLHHILAKSIISYSLDLSPTLRKLATQAIVQLNKEELLSKNQISAAFFMVFCRIEDLILDVPSAIQDLKEMLRILEIQGLLTTVFAEDLSLSFDAYQSNESSQSIRKKISNMLEEYFNSRDIEELERALVELNALQFHHKFVYKAIQMSCDYSNREKELVSQLISRFSSKNVLNKLEVRKGFQFLLLSVEEYKLDIPDAVNLFSRFLARAVFDEVLSPAFLVEQDLSPSDLGSEILRSAHALLKVSHAHLEDTWGCASDSLSDIKEAYDLILKEFFANSIIEETIVSLRGLKSDYFHHEFVFKAFSLALDQTKDPIPVLINLIQALKRKNVLSVQQLLKGLERIKSTLPEIMIDAPHAPEFFARLESEFALPEN
jgi:hypothetical protein